MQFIYDKSGLIFDLDNTLAELTLMTVISHPRLVGKLIHLKSACDRLRSLRHPDLMEALSDTLDMPIHELDRLTAKLYRKARIPKRIKRLISIWDETGKPRAIVSDHCGIGKLKAMGLDKGWSAVINCREHNAFKPLPDGLWAAAAQIGLPPSELVFIGDRSDTDGLAAYGFGCQFVDIRDL